jgi:MaoC like domain
MPQSDLGPYEVRAYNTAKESENKIHEDAVARRFGFKGGLVPGVEVYAYMTHLPVRRWGRAWLEHGAGECRFIKPVYDGDLVQVTANETASGLELRLESRGELCATGHAALPSPQPAPSAFSEAPLPPDPPIERPPADEATLPVGRWFAIHPFRMSAADGCNYLSDVRENLPLYAEQGLVHPGMILHIGNWALRHNALLGPWMHVGSQIEHFSAASIGDELSARALITDNYEQKGHRFVALDVLVYANCATPVARIAHTAIYRPRQFAAA